MKLSYLRFQCANVQLLYGVPFLELCNSLGGEKKVVWFENVVMLLVHVEVWSDDTCWFSFSSCYGQMAHVFAWGVLLSVLKNAPTKTYKLQDERKQNWERRFSLSTLKCSGWFPDTLGRLHLLMSWWFVGFSGAFLSVHYALSIDTCKLQ